MKLSKILGITVAMIFLVAAAEVGMAVRDGELPDPGLAVSPTAALAEPTTQAVPPLA